MAEKHDRLVARYRGKLLRQGYRIERRSPFVDYRPDIFATRRRLRLFVEAEIEATLHGDHALRQLEIMHRYLIANRNSRGILLVPRRAKREAAFLLESVFGDGRIGVGAL